MPPGVKNNYFQPQRPIFCSKFFFYSVESWSSFSYCFQFINKFLVKLDKDPAPTNFFLLWIYCKVDILYWFSKIVSLWRLLYWWNKEKLFFSGITNFSFAVGRIHLPDVVSYNRKTFEIFQEFLYNKLSFLICCC